MTVQVRLRALDCQALIQAIDIPSRGPGPGGPCRGMLSQTSSETRLSQAIPVPCCMKPMQNPMEHFWSTETLRQGQTCSVPSDAIVWIFASFFLKP